jgi:hypothetical protein
MNRRTLIQAALSTAMIAALPKNVFAQGAVVTPSKNPFTEGQRGKRFAMSMPSVAAHEKVQAVYLQTYVTILADGNEATAT